MNLSVSSGRRVFKFGGSSLGNASSLTRILEIVERECARGPIALVVSAMGDTTRTLSTAFDAASNGDAAAVADCLRRIEVVTLEAALGAMTARGYGSAAFGALVAQELVPARTALARVLVEGSRGADARDHVLAQGELVAASVVASMLVALGLPAEAVDSRGWLVTDEAFGCANVDTDATREGAKARARGWFTDGRVTVHTGFIARSHDGHTTTLGRNGSDYTATLLAAAVGATDVTVFTDVPGVMTADPAVVDDAYAVRQLSYGEAIELAGLGLGILHPRTMLPLVDAEIELRVCATMRDGDAATVIGPRGSTDPSRPTCIVSLEDLRLLEIAGTFRAHDGELATRVLPALAAAHVRPHLVAPGAQGNGLALVVARGDREAALAAARSVSRTDITIHEEPVALVTLVGEAMGRTPNVAGRFFAAIGAIGVNVLAATQGASSRSISCVVREADLRVVVQSVHAAMNLAADRVSLFVIGKGTVGGALLDILAKSGRTLEEEHDVAIRLVGLADRRAVWFDSRGASPESARTALAGAEAMGSGELLSALDELRRTPSPVLVDCTAGEGMEDIYAEALQRGIHVVTANKKPFVVPLQRRNDLLAGARGAHRALRYETTVGASLPVIETLKNLVRTGDRIVRIEGSLSGTLGFLANEVSRGVALSEAVRVAHAKGFTEPHPGEDLAGLDVARKALILARELGLDLELSDVEVEPFVTASVLRAESVADLFAALREHDAPMASRIASLRARGRVLRYIAEIVPGRHGERPSVKVGPVDVDHDHPAARLRGTEAMVAFTTERFDEWPLVVQGAGAGGPVTAAGLLADIVAVARRP